VPTDSPNRLQTVDRALQLLGRFTPERPVWGTSELARELGVAKSMVTRLLETLQAHGFVEQNRETRRYTLGLSLIRLGLVAQRTAGDLHRVAVPVMEQLTRDSGETSLLCVAREIHSVCIEQVLAPHQGLHLSIERGSISPLYAGASNKTLLAFLPAERIEQVIAAGLSTFTPDTVTDPDRLREQLAEIRRAGWFASSGEFTLDVAAVAAPIFDSRGRVIGALSLGGAATRYTPAYVAALVEKVRKAAEGLTRRLAGG